MKLHFILGIFFLLNINSFIFSQQEKPSDGLHFAVLQGNLEAVNQHIKAGTDLNEKDQFGSTPLIIAATFGKTKIAEALINAGADLNVTNNELSTPLHIASFFCRTEIVRALLENGADKSLRNINGSTAFDIVDAPFEYDKDLYDKLAASLTPLGLKIDYDYLINTRPQIAEMLKIETEELKEVTFTPLQRNDWKISTPEEQGLNPLLVSQLFYDAASLETLYSLLVIKNGYLVAEKYFNNGSVDQLSKRASVTKSYISALTGIAVDKGYIKCIDQKMIEFFPEITDHITNPEKKKITIRQMLQMRAGFPWEETDSVYWNALWSGKYVHKIVDFPLTADPGTDFQYSNLTSNWLGIITTRACGTDIKTFGQKYLFDPLGVSVGNWPRDLDGYYIGSGDIEITARDMAKFGQLYLDNGLYEGKQLISSEWIENSLKNYSGEINSAGIKSGRVGRYFHNIGYGFQWWSAESGEHHFNYAAGHGGQFIIILKDLNMIIVTTADPFYGKEEHFRSWRYEQSIYNLVGKFIKSLPVKEE
ncbi:MAG: serine hydrolase [Ignavibacteriales bacterium]|nr:MAG: serine hydrolase [Ignavibacteriales bacterium]